MSKFRELLKSPHIHIALAAGFSIIIMAFVSKRLLPKPIGYLPLAIPPFIATLFVSLLSKYKDAKFCKTWYWVVAILGATALIIVLHIF
ncbi:MAG: hypothetical protein A2V66_09645 [Ignavibacteria bacterium RBG_13_36_8]|nr:MAG: hypothetical protein A2V66_09645 [Ignavibacteria bacterium RBG_13_36_8]